MAQNRGHPPTGSEALRRGKPVALGALATSPPDDSDANWWIITLSDLTLLLFGFLALWHASGKFMTESGQLSTPAVVQHPTESRAVSPPEPELAPEIWQAVRNDLVRFIGSAGLTKEVTIESTPSELVLSLRDTVPFASAKADLRTQALPVLEKIVSVILAHPKLSVAVSGHTDSLRIATAEFPSNWELSTARASRVARYLVEKGLHPSRISVEGYADHRPRQPNSTPLNRRNNRRVEIRLFYQTLAPADGAGAR